MDNPTKQSKLSLLSRDTAAVLLIDHQIGLLTGVRDMNAAELKHNVVALAKAARVLGVPVVVTATMPDGMWGPTMPELTDALPGVQQRGAGSCSSPDSLEVCAIFPALSAMAAGQ